MALALSLVTALALPCHGASALGPSLGGKTLLFPDALVLGAKGHDKPAHGAVAGAGKTHWIIRVEESGAKAGGVPERNASELEEGLRGKGSWFPGQAVGSIVVENGSEWSPRRRRLLEARVPAACPKRCTKQCSPGNCKAIACCASQMGAARCVDYTAAAAACKKKKGPKSPGCQQATALYGIVGSTQVLLKSESRTCPSLKPFTTFYGLLRSWIVGLRARCCKA